MEATWAEGAAWLLLAVAFAIMMLWAWWPQEPQPPNEIDGLDAVARAVAKAKELNNEHHDP